MVSFMSGSHLFLAFISFHAFFSLTTQKPKTQSYVHAGGISAYLELMCRSKTNLTPDLAKIQATGTATLSSGDKTKGEVDEHELFRPLSVYTKVWIVSVSRKKEESIPNVCVFHCCLHC